MNLYIQRLLRILQPCPLLFILLVASNLSHAKTWNRFTTTEEPGECFYRVRHYSRNNVRNVLAYSTDYGSTYVTYHTDITCGRAQYHMPTGDLWVSGGNEDFSGFFVSHDLWQSYDEVEVFQSGTWWTIMQDVDSLVILIQYRRWSFDTLRTYQLGTGYGFEGESVDYCPGWQNGQVLFLTHQGDTVKTLISNDFSNTFEQINSTTDIDTFGLVYRGYEPGELYFVSLYTQQLSVSTDWGESWTEGYSFPLDHNIWGFWFLSLYPGWGPGEVMAHWEGPPIEDEDTFLLLYSDDYGATFERMNQPENTVTYLDSDSNIPQENRIELWPNPANGFVTIQLTQFISGEMAIYNIQGNQVLKRAIPDFSHSVSLSLTDFSSGTYFLQWQAGGVSEVRKVVLLK